MSLKRGVDRMFKQIPGASFAVQYWDGETITYGEEKPEFLLRLRDTSSVRRMLRNPFLRLVALEHGGHLGFLARRHPRFWLDALVMDWVAEVGNKAVIANVS